MNHKKLELITLLCIVIMISIFITPGLAEAQSIQQTYTPRPTYTSLPTYTPQGLTPTATPLPTATPYSNPSAGIDNSLSEDARYSELFTLFFESHPILASEYSFGDFHRSNKIIEGSAGYCYAINNTETSHRFGELCMYRKAASQIQEFSQTQTEIEEDNPPNLGNFVKLFSGVDDGQKYYRIILIKNDWVINGFFEGDYPGILSEIPKIVNSFFEQSPQELFSSSVDENDSNEIPSSTDNLKTLLDSAIAEGLPEGVEAGDFTLDNQAGVVHAIYHLFRTNDGFHIGDMSAWKYTGIQLDSQMTTLNNSSFSYFPVDHTPFITGGPTFGDRSVEYRNDDNPEGEMNVHRFQKFDTYAEVRIFRDVDDALKLGREITKLIEDHIQEPQITPMLANSDVLEQQFTNCFPKAGDLGFEREFSQFSITTDMFTEGISYSTRYNDFRTFDTWAPLGTLFITIKEFVLPPTGQDLPTISRDYFADAMEDIDPSLGERSEAVSLHNLYNKPKTYDYFVYFYRQNTLVTLNMTAAEYYDDTLSNMVSIARQMDACLPENPIPVTSISVPIDNEKALLNKELIFIEDFNKFDNGDDPHQGDLPLLVIPANIKMFIPQQAQLLPGPLTIAIYNPDRGFYTFKKQEKEIPPYGDYFSIIRQIDYSIFIEGRNELHIWSGDQLILVYPFAFSKEYGDRQ